MEAPCPVLLGYISALREEFRRTPSLYEPQIEELDLCEARLCVDRSPERARNFRELRAFRCLELALQVYSNSQVHLGVPIDLKTPSAPTLEGMKAHLLDRALGYQAEAGEIGLMGMRKDDQQLRYSRLEEAGDLGDFCVAFAELVQACMHAPWPDGDLDEIADVGRLFHKACVMGKAAGDDKVKFARELLEPHKVKE